jgi:N-acetylmuramoyl-L-alanine amidase
MKLCIDPGHGLSNRTRGVYDPGAVSGIYEEASIALVWSHELRKACEDVGIAVWMTRVTRDEAAPIGTRVRRALDAGCDQLVSIHVNDFADPTANGYETLVPPRLEKTAWARGLHHTVRTCLQLRDRGIQPRPSLAVLKFPGPCALLELGFIGFQSDRNRILNNAVMQVICRQIANYLAGFEPTGGSPDTTHCTCS